MRNQDHKMIEEILKDYSLQDILEENDMSDADALLILWEEGYIVLPETLPVTINRFSEGDSE